MSRTVGATSECTVSVVVGAGRSTTAAVTRHATMRRVGGAEIFTGSPRGSDPGEQWVLLAAPSTSGRASAIDLRRSAGDRRRVVLGPLRETLALGDDGVLRILGT